MDSMQHRGKGFVLAYAILAVVVLAFVGISEAATREIPPLFRDDPESRSLPINQADDEVDDYRLPNHTIPWHYDIELTTNVDVGDKFFQGSVSIWITVEVETDHIVLHKRRTNITYAMLRGGDGTEHPLSISFEAKREFLTLSAGIMMLVGSQWEVVLRYDGELRTDNAGFYLSTYKDEANNTRYLATTQFESTDARHAFPCYDEPAKRATFTITIHHDAKYNAISNMPVNELASTAGMTVFDKTQIMPTYLIAFIVSDFTWTEGNLNGLTQRIYSRPGTQNQQEWALVSGMLITERLGEYYGIPFAFPKLDQVAVPDFAAGAMENWGLVTYREEYLLYDKEKSTVNTQTNIANIIAHEYTHQWFGNLVAVRWWTYLWMKEGFATLYSYQATDDAYPEWGIFQLFHTSEYQNALNSDASLTSRPMTHYVQTPNEISRLYDSISYSKAGCVLNMWQNALTDKVFRDGLNIYLETNKYNSAVEENLFTAIDTGAKNQNYVLPDSISNMMSTWTRQGGYPLLMVVRDYNSGSFTVKQMAFFNNETLTSNKTWYIPFNYAHQSKVDFRHTEAMHYLKNEQQITVQGKIPADDWLILNKQSTGYYRIHYDDKNWELITQGLMDRPYRVHPRNRAQLMHDAYRFSSSNRLKHEILLNLMWYLKNEDQLAPWSTANSIMTTFNRYLSGDEDYYNFQQYMAEIVTPIYEKLGVDDISGEQHFQKNVRSIVINLACMAGIQNCLLESTDKLIGYVDNGIEIEPNLQSQIYCNGMKQVDDKYYDAIYNKLMASEDQAERRMLISSLGCSQKSTQLMKFISSSIDDTNDLRTQERTTLLLPTYSRGSVGLLTSIDFLDGNWLQYGSLTAGSFGGSKPLDSDIRSMSQYVVNDEQKEKLMALVAKVKDSSLVTSTLEEAVTNNVNANMEWLNQNRKPLMSYVNSFYRSSGHSAAASFASIGLALIISLRRLL